MSSCSPTDVDLGSRLISFLSSFGIMIKINGKLSPNTIHIIHIGRVNALRRLVALDLS